MANAKSLVAASLGEVASIDDIHAMLPQVREEWRTKNLIERVKNLLPVDPSSACQRLLNASIHDLREKIKIAGLDIASEAAKQQKLPAVSKSEDIDSYSTANVLHLVYHMGLLRRPAWRRLRRAYDIRKDLEHEDDEYEASAAECGYIFETCIRDVLSQDPIQSIKLVDVMEIVEQSELSVLTKLTLEEFEHAPEPRQKEIYQYLISISLDASKPDIVRENCYRALACLHDITRRNVLFDVAKHFVKRIGRGEPSVVQFRVAYVAGVVPYLKKLQVKAFFESYWKRLHSTSHHWSNHEFHRSLLADLEEIGGLRFCPKELMEQFAEWLVLCYIGEPGGYGRGLNRPVFYSDIGAPMCLQILRMSKLNDGFFYTLRESSDSIARACRNEHVARRLDHIINAIEQ